MISILLTCFFSKNTPDEVEACMSWSSNYPVTRDSCRNSYLFLNWALGAICQRQQRVSISYSCSSLLRSGSKEYKVNICTIPTASNVLKQKTQSWKKIQRCAVKPPCNEYNHNVDSNRLVLYSWGLIFTSLFC